MGWLCPLFENPSAKPLPLPVLVPKCQTRVNKGDIVAWGEFIPDETPTGSYSHQLKGGTRSKYLRELFDQSFKEDSGFSNFKIAEYTRLGVLGTRQMFWSECRFWEQFNYKYSMWPNAEKTERLLSDARGGNAEAVERLLAEFREPLRKVVDLRLDPALARRVDASDIVQDVLLEANLRLIDYLRSPNMPFHLWLRHLAQDRIIDTHRRHRQAQRRSVDREQAIQGPTWDDESSVQLISQLIDTEHTPASAAIHQELERKLSQALREIPEADREIILMRHQEQLSNQDVAAALGLSEAAASMRYLRALRKLRSVLLPESKTEGNAEA